MMLLFEMQNDGTAARNGTLPIPTVAHPPSSHRAPASSPAHDSCGFGSRIWAWGPVDGHTRTTAPSPVYNISHKYRVEHWVIRQNSQRDGRSYPSCHWDARIAALSHCVLPDGDGVCFCRKIVLRARQAWTWSGRSILCLSLPFYH